MNFDKIEKPRKKPALIVSITLGLVIVVFGVLIGTSLIRGRSSQTTMPGASGGAASGSGARPGGDAMGGAAPGGGARPGGGAGAATRQATLVRAEAVNQGTIETSVVLNGDILLGSPQVSLYATLPQGSNAKLVETRFTLGDTVRQGDTVAIVDPSRPGVSYSRSPVISTASGTVIQTPPVVLGDSVTASTPIYVLSDLNNLLLETYVPERYVLSIRKGLPALVTLAAIPNETFDATVDEISPTLDAASRTLKIRLRFSQPDTRIRAGMFATVSLVTDIHDNVLVIPRAALINTYGTWVVFTVDEGNVAHRREIELGLESESIVEIVAGLSQGERVVSAGQNFLSDGDTVSVVE
ncbi:MAG: efflux RND transporter periplasmic adaptor subunit [Treponema sp.]|jgi:multidrug efflux pump subunit AcrA (membrane-fusion protein)|nr:efflux RND transporter periplasmic adaptor subunit [Treponema sp.]